MQTPVHFRTWLLALVVTLAVVSAFYAGRYIGEHDEKKRHEVAGELERVSSAAITFQFAMKTRQALLNSDEAFAHLLLLRQAAVIAGPSLLKCSSSPLCIAHVGSQMPTKTELEQATVAERAANEALPKK